LRLPTLLAFGVDVKSARSAAALRATGPGNPARWMIERFRGASAHLSNRSPILGRDVRVGRNPAGGVLPLGRRSPVVNLGRGLEAVA
jgi:hypothetical protein